MSDNRQRESLDEHALLTKRVDKEGRHHDEVVQDRKRKASLADLVQQINKAHKASEEAYKSGFQHAIHAGELLVEAKRLVPHGRWGSWLSQNFKGTPRLAQMYMRAFRRRDEIAGKAKAQHVSQLSLRGAIEIMTEPQTEKNLQEHSTRNAETISVPAFVHQSEPCKVVIHRGEPERLARTAERREAFQPPEKDRTDASALKQGMLQGEKYRAPLKDSSEETKTKAKAMMVAGLREVVRFSTIVEPEAAAHQVATDKAIDMREAVTDAYALAEWLRHYQTALEEAVAS